MSEIIIEGGKRLTGTIVVQGAKNSVLPVLAGTVLCSENCVIHNCPSLTDVETSVQILQNLGCVCEKNQGTVRVDSSRMNSFEIPDGLMREMRSSVVFLGAILGRSGKAVISTPGGCELGPRPIDLHLAALERMGVTVREEHGYLYCEAENGLHGAEIHLSFPSVGATENIMLAAATAAGDTLIHNAAKEPEISDLADFLNSAGARIYGSGSDTVTIHGVKALHATEHTIIPDRIAAATYMAAAALTGGRITLENIMPPHMVALFWFFRECGCELEISGKSVTVTATKPLCRVPTVRSMVYPGFPTDAGPIALAVMSKAKGTSVFVENIFENRFRYVDELKRFGANIKTEGKAAVVEGVPELSGANCACTDLRGGAALVLAALCANGVSRIANIRHIERGYENITENLQSVGAVIRQE
ncbi:MAG: UDP-N-acetylglucosamine 1-carboxyvinyltransferase [Clostridia bacterium]|nr:UDP-N-acetylglucosamine 1-carboxyvinyltransferase [Clostridia bacterium]